MKTKMKKNLLLIFAIGITLFGTQSCKKIKRPCIKGKGEVVTQERKVDPFNGIDLRIAADVVVTMDLLNENPTIVVEAHGNLQSYISTEVVGEALIIESSRCIKGYSPIIVYISTSYLESLSISGSGNIEVINPIQASSFNSKISGSGNIIMNVKTASLETSISGSGYIDISGEADVANFSISGSGNVYGNYLATEEAEVNISGSGDLELTVENKLDVSISGSGDVRYKGRPALTVDISGSGNVTQIN